MKRSTLVNWLLVVAVVALTVLPLLLVSGEFSGADGLAEEAITESHPDYEPWFSSVYEPPSGEVEGGLFALQAALGAGVVGYYFGVARTRSKRSRVDASRPDVEDLAVAGARPAPDAPASPHGGAGRRAE